MLKLKIAIGICKKLNGRCSSVGCFRAYNNKDKYFVEYKDIDTELIAFFSCDICEFDSTERLEKIANKLKLEGVDKVHLGHCAVKCKADKSEEIKGIFKSLDIDIVEGTH